MAFPAIGAYNGGVCPQSHPVAIYSVFYEFYYDTSPFTDFNKWVYAMGDPTGYGLHGDFINGWKDQNALEQAAFTCTGPQGAYAPTCSINVCPSKLFSFLQVCFYRFGEYFHQICSAIKLCLATHEPFFDTVALTLRYSTGWRGFCRGVDTRSSCPSWECRLDWADPRVARNQSCHWDSYKSSDQKTQKCELMLELYKKQQTKTRFLFFILSWIHQQI